MAIKIQIEGELTRDGLLRLRQEIDALLESIGDGPRPVHGPALPPSAAADDEQELAYRKVGALWERLGLKTRTFLSTCSLRPAGQEFTFEDLAAELNESVATVKSWHRNLSRSLRRVEEVYGGQPPLLQRRWGDDKNYYSLSPEVRQAIQDQHPAKSLGSDAD
jgi:hypothetical protein